MFLFKGEGVEASTYDKTSIIFLFAEYSASGMGSMNRTFTFDGRHASVTTRCLRNEPMACFFYYYDLSQRQSVRERTCARAEAWEDWSGDA